VSAEFFRVTATKQSRRPGRPTEKELSPPTGLEKYHDLESLAPIDVTVIEVHVKAEFLRHIIRSANIAFKKKPWCRVLREPFF
jgi:hypothetical protein